MSQPPNLSIRMSPSNSSFPIFHLKLGHFELHSILFPSATVTINGVVYSISKPGLLAIIGSKIDSNFH
ncbi:hypothetical protein CDL12_17983 [Handroanthus impetiginosus]|uniref:Uncharacterized protein n=1 Tax=Handroanthus impetiginosus TaxID=429701 RepID=A0A2G9GW48_9LAMI|nr:hypothetical protein CDL12_17983 [Handroanthus impetiginosus]